MQFREQLSNFHHRRAIRWHVADLTVLEFTYFDVLAASQSIEDILKTIHPSIGSKSQFLAVVLGHCPSIVPVIVACLNCSITFGCIQPDGNWHNIRKSCDHFEADLLVVQVGAVIANDFIEFREVEVLGQKLQFLWLRTTKQRLTHDGEALMFCASTSGSTGQPKVIGVPFSCLISNVIGLIRYYQLSDNDLIYVSSPPTFDPFVLDIFLALTCGSTIVMVANGIRLEPKLLLQALFPATGCDGVTVMQITPSLFKRWHDQDIVTSILASESSLRCLIFGGEPPPCVADLKRWKNWNTTIPRLFNIYGCTEQSCWTTIHEISFNDIFVNGAIPLGEPIDIVTDTLVVQDVVTGQVLANDGVGELYLTSTKRFCRRLGENDSTFDKTPVKTGDIVSRRDSVVYFHSRLDDVVKRYGTKVQLRTIETKAKLVTDVLEACCVFDRQSQALILYIVVCEMVEDVEATIRKVRAEIETQNVDYIKMVERLPLSYHGKVSKSKLLDMHKKNMILNKSETPVQFFVNQLNQTLQCERNDSGCASIMRLSFRAAGGTSFMALNMLSALETTFNRPFTSVMAMLLDERKELEAVVKNLEMECNDRTEQNAPTSSIQQTVSLTLLWLCNLDKCIDAAPTVCRLPDFGFVVSCGSHSRRLVNVRLTDGHRISELRLPDRIEGQVRQHQTDLGLVGCYDGRLYCFELTTGTIRWHFDTGDMIKCRARVVRNTIIFGNYGTYRNVWGLNAETGTLRWSTKIGLKSIYANPCGMGDTNTVLICTLDGTYARVCSDTGKSVWTRQTKTPIFSSPRQLLNSERIVMAEVDGTVHCIDFDGATLWQYRADGNVFSSFAVMKSHAQGHVVSVMFGCYDQHVYCLNVSAKIKDEFSVAWRCPVNGQIFATPTAWEEEYVLACTTTGHIVVIRRSDGKVIGSYKADGEIFSSPAVCDIDRLIVGCRNNSLYCFRFVKNSE